MSGLLWHNGAFKPDDAPIFRADDRVRLGDGVFDTMPIINSRPVHARLHYARLCRHAAVLGIQIPYEWAAYEEALRDLMARNGMPLRTAVNTVLTHGPGQRGLAPPENPDPQTTLRLTRLPREFPPVSAVIAQTVRRNEGSPLSRIKSLNYGDNILALREAQDNEADEAILPNNAGFIACATIGSVFILKGGTLSTPPLSDGAIDGIARDILLRAHGAQEKNLSERDLHEADGIYIVNSLRGASPVLELDGKKRTETALPFDKDFHLS